MGAFVLSVCSSCGHTDSSFNPLFCKVCGKEGCHDCMTYLFSYFQYGIEPQFQENWYCHTSKCYETFAQTMEKNLTAKIFNEQKFGIGLLRTIFYNALTKNDNQFWLKKNISSSLLLDDFLFTNGNLDLVARIEKFGTKKINKNH